MDNFGGLKRYRELENMKLRTVHLIILFGITSFIAGCGGDSLEDSGLDNNNDVITTNDIVANYIWRDSDEGTCLHDEGLTPSVEAGTTEETITLINFFTYKEAFTHIQNETLARIEANLVDEEFIDFRFGPIDGLAVGSGEFFETDSGELEESFYESLSLTCEGDFKRGHDGNKDQIGIVCTYSSEDFDVNLFDDSCFFIIDKL